MAKRWRASSRRSNSRTTRASSAPGRSSSAPRLGYICQTGRASPSSEPSPSHRWLITRVLHCCVHSGSAIKGHQEGQREAKHSHVGGTVSAGRGSWHDKVPSLLQEVQGLTSSTSSLRTPAKVAWLFVISPWQMAWLLSTSRLSWLHLLLDMSAPASIDRELCRNSPPVM